MSENKKSVLMISQVFWPDTASSAQHLFDLAKKMVREGKEVIVITSQRAYESSKKKFVKYERYDGIQIIRIRNTGFSKNSKYGRLLNFATFNINVFIKLLNVKKDHVDMIVGLAAPPLLSFMGIIVSKLKKIKFCYWAMDLQPELAIAAGYIKKGGYLDKLMSSMANYIFKNADLTIALDKYMAEYINSKGIEKGKIHVSTVWPVVESIYMGNRSDNPFRKEHKFGNRLVVMYSGNHSVMHPLNTLLKCALDLKNNDNVLFVFIGEGIRKNDVSVFKEKYGLDNIIQLPYQPREKIHLSLSSADFQVVIQGEKCIGITHPNKIYGAMYIGCAIIYIGPREGHIMDALEDCPNNIIVEHGEHEVLSEKINYFVSNIKEIESIGEINKIKAHKKYDKKILLNCLYDKLNETLKN